MPRSLTTHIDSSKKVGKRLKKARERAKLSQRQLAFPGCTAAYISRLEAGARVPSLQMINELAKKLEVSGPWLAKGEGPMYISADDTIKTTPGLTPGQQNLLLAFDGVVVSADDAKQLRQFYELVHQHRNAAADIGATALHAVA